MNCQVQRRSSLSEEKMEASDQVNNLVKICSGVFVYYCLLQQMPSPKLQFMQELQRLFSLLLTSKQQYVDPSAAIKLLTKQSAALKTESTSGVRIRVGLF